MREAKQCPEVPSPPADAPLRLPPPPAASYFDGLAELRRALAGAVLSWNDLQATVHRVNAQVQEETNREWSPGQVEAARRGQPILYRESGPLSTYVSPS